MTAVIAVAEQVTGQTGEQLGSVLKIERRLAEAQTLEEFVAVRADAEVLRALARRVHKTLYVQNKIALVGTLAEHRAGSMLAALERTPGARTDLVRPPTGLAGGSPYQRGLAEKLR